MAVFRVNKTKNYTIMSNTHLKDMRLTLKAKGLLSMMLGFPEDWNYSIAGLVAICKENETAIKSTLEELKKTGYLVVTKMMPNETNSGRIEYIYDIFEQPCELQEEGMQGVENLSVENLSVENPSQLNTKELNTKELNKKNNIKNKQKSDLAKTSTGNGLELIREKITSKKGAADNQAVETVINHLNELAGTRYRPTKADTIKVITARLKEGYSVDDLKLVVSYKCDEWMGTDMQKYLRPETLFRPSKFEGYLNAATSGAPARKRASNADTSSGKKVSTAFRDLSETEQKKNLSGLKF